MQEFFDNVSRYPRYLISVSFGIFYNAIAPLVPLAQATNDGDSPDWRGDCWLYRPQLYPKSNVGHCLALFLDCSLFPKLLLTLWLLADELRGYRPLLSAK